MSHLSQDSGRIPEPAEKRRWRRVWSWLTAQTLGRVSRRARPGRSRERNSELTRTATGTSTVTVVEQGEAADEVGGGGDGRRPWYRVRRWRARGKQQRSGDATRRQRKTSEKAAKSKEGRGGGSLAEVLNEEVLKEEPEILPGAGDVQKVDHPSGAAAVTTAGAAGTAMAAAAIAPTVATDGLVGVNRGDATSQSGVEVDDPALGGRISVLRPAEYDGEMVLPETWAKVDELRSRAERCDPEAGEEEKGLQLWLAGGGGEGREGLTDTDLLRFVMFRHGDVDAAWRQLKQAAAWRQRRGVEDVLSEEQWSRHKELQAEIFWIGRDAEGRPTMVLRSIAHHPGAIDSEDFQRYFLYLLEQGRQLYGLGAERQLNIIVDRIGAGVKNQDPRLLGSMLPVFRDAYPDIVYRCYVAPTSWIFRFVWVIAARLVDDRQRKRVLLLVGDWKSRLLEDFDASVLPVHLGGTMAEYPPKQPPDM
ncbi:unnamed protein product [Scytosiphon promiscuus]